METAAKALGPSIMKTLFGNSGIADDLSWVGMDKNNRPRYSILEASWYVGVKESTLRSWVIGRQFPRGGGKGFSEPLIRLPHGANNLSFVNLVEAHILQCVKVDAAPADVRKILDYLSQEMGSEHPLIEHDFATHGKALFIKGMKHLVSGWGQYNIDEVLEDLLKDVEWRDDRVFRLFPRSEKTNRLIVMNPSLSSGRPVVTGSGVLAAMIWKRHEEGESIDTLARDYRLGPEAIKAAIDFTRAA